MQPFDIIDRNNGAFVRMYMANSRDDALKQHFSEVGSRDDSVKAVGPKGPKHPRVKFRKPWSEATKRQDDSEERKMGRLRRQSRGDGFRCTSIPADGRKPGKSRLKLAAKR